MKRLRICVFPICILLLGLSGCITSVGTQPCRLGSMNECNCPKCTKLRSSWAAKDREVKVKQEVITAQFINSMNSWIGHHISELIRRKGPAAQIADDAAGGQIYVWVQEIEMQRRVKKQPLFPRVPRKTKTQGTMRWDPLYEQWEFESETVPTRTAPPDGAELLLELHRQRKTETYTTGFRIMFYTRADGTIYHWLID